MFLNSNKIYFFFFVNNLTFHHNEGPIKALQSLTENMIFIFLIMNVDLLFKRKKHNYFLFQMNRVPIEDEKRLVIF